MSQDTEPSVPLMFNTVDQRQSPKCFHDILIHNEHNETAQE